MSVFEYQAYNQDGKKCRGEAEGDSEKGVRQQLRLQGFTPIVVSLVTTEANTGKFQGLQFFKRISIEDLSLMTRELSALIGAGLPVEEALMTLTKQTDNRSLKSVVMGVRDKVIGGYSLAKGFAEYPRVFSKIYTATISAGEESGHLTEVLEHLADYTERQQQIKSKIKQALLYPALMTLVSCTIIVFLLIFIVPSLINVFAESQTKLPILTRVLISISNFLTYFWYILLFLIGGVMLSFHWLLKKAAFRKSLHGFLLQLPLIGRSLITTNTARFAQTLGILIEAGVPVIHALQISTDLITLIPMQEKIRSMINRVSEGSTLHTALRSTGYFNPLMLHFVANGEATGRLDEMLKRAASNQERKMMMLIDSVLTLFEPLLIIVMGGIVLFIVLAVLIPLFQITQLVV